LFVVQFHLLQFVPGNYRTAIYLILCPCENLLKDVSVQAHRRFTITALTAFLLWIALVSSIILCLHSMLNSFLLHRPRINLGTHCTVWTLYNRQSRSCWYPGIKFYTVETYPRCFKCDHCMLLFIGVLACISTLLIKTYINIVHRALLIKPYKSYKQNDCTPHYRTGWAIGLHGQQVCFLRSY
jgi:hypothetical protein